MSLKASHFGVACLFYLLGIYARTGLVTFYGPAVAASFGEFPPYVDETFENFVDVLTMGEDSSYTYAMPPFWTDQMVDWKPQSGPKDRRPNAWVTARQGKAEGRLIGGNLNTLEGIFGTGYMPEIRNGDILLIEDTGLNPQEIERPFSLLLCAGVFDRVSGIILGKHELYDDMGTGRKPYEVL